MASNESNIEMNLDRTIAELLGWRLLTREIRSWEYLGDRRIAVPRVMSYWLLPDKTERYSLPRWSAEDDEIVALIRELTTEEKSELGLLYMGLGWLDHRSPFAQGVYAETMAKAFIALKQKKQNPNKSHE
jgi:hypothetical protein